MIIAAHMCTQSTIRSMFLFSVVTAVYQPNSYTVDEDAGTAFICVAIISSSPVQSSLSADSTVRVTFADDSASGSGRKILSVYTRVHSLSCMLLLFVCTHTHHTQFQIKIISQPLLGIQVQCFLFRMETW